MGKTYLFNYEDGIPKSLYARIFKFLSPMHHIHINSVSVHSNQKVLSHIKNGRRTYW